VSELRRVGVLWSTYDLSSGVDFVIINSDLNSATLEKVVHMHQ
jgi:hypothetical protein